MRSAFVISASEEGLSLLQYLKGKFSCSGKSIKRSIEASGCYVNNRLERFASKKLKIGDQVSFELKKTESKLLPLATDPYFKVWEKESGFVCDKRCLLHRLDKETSGLLMTSEEEAFFSLFRERKITKKYLAVVCGHVKEESGDIKFPIGVLCQEKGKKTMGVMDEGKYAHTRYRVIKKGAHNTLLELELITGRTHQIRVHMAHIGHPVIGDYHYDPTQERRVGRVLLHATDLQFTHPITKESMQFHSKPPKEFYAHLST